MMWPGVRWRWRREAALGKVRGDFFDHGGVAALRSTWAGGGGEREGRARFEGAGGERGRDAAFELTGFGLAAEHGQVDESARALLGERFEFFAVREVAGGAGAVGQYDALRRG